MSHFYASIQGNRGEATRMGHSGITGHVRGWNAGVRVNAAIEDAGNDPHVGQDKFLIYATSGSNGGKADKFLGIVVDTKDGPIFQPANDPPQHFADQEVSIPAVVPA